MTTVSIVVTTGSLDVRLSIVLQDLDIHRGVNPTEDLSGFVSVVFVTGVD